MATQHSSHKKRQQLWLPIAQQIPGLDGLAGAAGAAGAGGAGQTAGSPLGVNPALLQQIQTSTTSSLNTLNAQGATQNALAQRNTGLQVYTGLALGNTVGAIGIGATPLQVTATNFGVTAGGGGGGGGGAPGG